MTSLLALRLSVGAVLALSATEKLRDFGAFKRGVAGYDLLPRHAVPIVAWVVAATEVVLAIGLLSGMGTAVASGGAVLLFAAFTVAVGINLIRGNRVPCHCFGAQDSETIGGITVARSASLIALSAAIFAISINHPSSDFESASQALAAISIAMGAVVLTRLVGLLPWAWQVFKKRGSTHATRHHRVSFRNESLDISLLPAHAPEQAESHPDAVPSEILVVRPEVST